MRQLLSGQTENARATVDSIASDPGQLERLHLVFLYDMLGERETALDWLERNYDSRHSGMPLVRFAPILKPLHGEPRFEAVVERIGRPTIDV